MQTLFKKADRAGLEGLHDHLTLLKVKYCAGGLTDSAKAAIKNAIDELESLLGGENGKSTS